MLLNISPQDPHPEEERCFKCDLCGKRFNRQFLLWRHHLTHSTHKAFECHICGKRYKLNQHLDGHIKNKHSNEKHKPKRVEEFSCDVCNLKFKSKLLLTLHKRKFKHLTGMVGCGSCGEMFSNINSLKVHEKEKHSAVQKAHICELCGKSLASDKSLKAHVHTHSHRFVLSAQLVAF